MAGNRYYGWNLRHYYEVLHLGCCSSPKSVSSPRVERNANAMKKATAKKLYAKFFKNSSKHFKNL